MMPTRKEAEAAASTVPFGVMAVGNAFRTLQLFADGILTAPVVVCIITREGEPPQYKAGEQADYWRGQGWHVVECIAAPK